MSWKSDMAQILAQHTTKEDTHMPHFTETGRCQRTYMFLHTDKHLEPSFIKTK